MKGELFAYCDPNDINATKFAYVWIQLYFTEMEKSSEAMLEKFFQIQCLHVIYTFYLYFVKFVTITFETSNNIYSKNKALFTFYEKF